MWIWKRAIICALVLVSISTLVQWTYLGTKWERLILEINAGMRSISSPMSKNFKDVNILCWISMKPDEKRKAVAVMDTWGKRCSPLIFFSSEKEIGQLPVVKILEPEEDTYKKLWGKTRRALIYLWHHHNTTDWFWKADTNSYTIIENLKYLIKDLDPNEPHYMGFRYKMGHNSGSGYLLSRRSLQLIVGNGFESKTNPCKSKNAEQGIEDLLLYRCIKHIGLFEPEDTRDNQGKHRFFPIMFEKHLMPQIITPIFWGQPYYSYPRGKFPACCSDVSINFHEVTPSQMYLMEFFLYHLRVKGILKEDKEYNVHNRA